MENRCNYRKCLAIYVGRSIRGKDVVNVLERMKIEKEIIPKRIQTDNGSEFISKGMDYWAYENKVTMDYSRPGKQPTIRSWNHSMEASGISV